MSNERTTAAMIGVNDMREEYDFSNAEKNPYAKRMKK